MFFSFSNRIIIVAAVTSLNTPPLKSIIFMILHVSRTNFLVTSYVVTRNRLLGTINPKKPFSSSNSIPFLRNNENKFNFPDCFFLSTTPKVVLNLLKYDFSISVKCSPLVKTHGGFPTTTSNPPSPNASSQLNAFLSSQFSPKYSLNSSSVPEISEFPTLMFSSRINGSFSLGFKALSIKLTEAISAAWRSRSTPKMLFFNIFFSTSLCSLYSSPSISSSLN